MTVQEKHASNGLSPAARELAEAMRQGLEARRAAPFAPVGHTGLSWPPAPANGHGSSLCLRPESRGALQAHANVLGHPPVAKAGRAASLIRFVRRTLRAFLRPWLEVQTRFNHSVIDVLESLHASLRQEIDTLHRRVDQCNQVLYTDLKVQLEQIHKVLHSQAAEISAVSDQVDTMNARLEDYYDAAVNRELSHKGKIAENGLWFNPPVVVQLHKEHASAVCVTERILEHIFVHTRLPRPPARVLDLGCAESLNAIEMATLGYDVVGVDLRPLPLEHPSLRLVQADIADLPFPDACFDVVVSLSTLEHVGLDWYTPVPAGSSDRKAIEEVRRVLRQGGRFILTAPFGRSATTPMHRVYDRGTLESLLSPLHIQEFAFGLRTGETWSYTTDSGRAEQAESKDRVSAIALVVAERP